MMDEDVLHRNSVGGRLHSMLLPERELDSEGLRFGPRDMQTYWLSKSKLVETKQSWQCSVSPRFTAFGGGGHI